MRKDMFGNTRYKIGLHIHTSISDGRVSPEESARIYKEAGFDAYFVDHTAGVFPTAASGFPWTAASMQVKGDPIADLTEDLAAEEPIKYW